MLPYSSDYIFIVYNAGHSCQVYYLSYSPVSL
nr:MAG TPA: hypothetical protein [Crassvirales sp.]